jgi:hypothetical protein
MNRLAEQSAVGSAIELASGIGLGVLCAMAFLWDAFLVRVMVSLNMNDFGRFYYSTRAFLAGQDMYAPSPATQLGAGRIAGAQQLLNLNPPHVHLLVLPLARLSPSVAVTLWMLASVCALVTSLLIIGHELEFVATSKRVLLLTLFVLMFSGSQAVFITGQLTFFLLLPTTLCWREARRRHWGRVGAWLGVCTSVKPFLLIFVPYLMGHRRWRACAAMGATTAACFAAGLLLFGSDSYASWLRAVTHSGDWAWLGMNASLLGILQRLFTPTPSFRAAILEPGLVRLWVVVVSAVAVATFLVVLVDKSSTALDRAFALCLVAAQLISPLGWVYYLWLAAGPVAAVAFPPGRSTSLSQPGGPFLALALVGFLTPIVAPYYFQPSSWATVTLGSAYCWAAMALWGYLVIDFAHAGAERRRF